MGLSACSVSCAPGLEGGELNESTPVAAGGKDVSLAGGANAARQYLAAGLVDEMEINRVPTLLGSGEWLFEGVGDNLNGLEPVRTVARPTVTHLKFARR